MRYSLITIGAVLLLVSACSDAKERPAASNDKSEVSEPTASQSAKATAAAALPDWSKLFASGLCPLSGEEIQAALGLSDTVSTKEEYGACWFRVADKNIGSIVAAPTSAADLAKRKKGSEENVVMGLGQTKKSGESSASANVFSQIKLTDPTLYAVWRGSSYSHLHIYTRDRIVYIKSMDPVPPSPQGQEAYDASKAEREAAYLERQARAIKIANALSAKAK